MEAIIKYLKQPSTWAGGTVLASVVGIFFSPEHVKVILQAGGSIVALILIFTDTSKSSPESKQLIENLQEQLLKKK